MFICLKNAASSRIPAAESGRETPTTFRLLKKSVLRPADLPDPAWRESGESRTRERGRREKAPPCTSGRPGRSPRRGESFTKPEGAGTARQRSSEGQRLGSRPPLPARRRLPAAARGPARARRVGEGVSPAAPPPAARWDLLIKTSTPSRCRSASYLRATAAAASPALASPKHCRNDSSPAALKIPDKESRNSRFPTSQSLVPAPAPPPVAAVAAAAPAAPSDSTSRPRTRSRRC